MAQSVNSDPSHQAALKIHIRSNFSMHTTQSYLEAHKNITPKSYRLKTEGDQTLDRDCVLIIDDRAPNRLSKFLKTKGLSQRWYTKSKTNSITFDRAYQNQKLKVMTEVSTIMTNRSRLRQKLGIKKQQNFSFHRLSKKSLSYFQQKYTDENTTHPKGRYNEKMHPLCRIYQEEANKIYRDSKTVKNPFDVVCP